MKVSSGEMNMNRGDTGLPEGGTRSPFQVSVDATCLEHCAW